MAGCSSISGGNHSFVKQVQTLLLPRQMGVLRRVAEPSSLCRWEHERCSADHQGPPHPRLQEQPRPAIAR